jgi:hypothetical protein
VGARRGGLLTRTILKALTAGAVMVVTVTVGITTAAASPTLSAPTSGTAGNHILISGGGWPGYDTVYAYLDQGSTDTYFCELDTNASGNLGPEACTLPTTLTRGAYTLEVTDETLSASQTFTLDPSSTASDTSSGAVIGSVAAGQTLYLAGAGFDASTTITSVKVGGTAVTTTPAAPATTADGSFSGATFTVPSATPAGTSTVTVTDADGFSAKFNLTVYTATLTAPTPGVSGRNLAVSGTGWPINVTVYAYLDQGATQNYFCELDTDGSGDLGPGSCALPTTLPEGSYTLSLTDEAVTVNEAFTLDPGAHVSQTTSGAAIGSVADSQLVYLTGSGFGASTTITSVKVGTKTVTTSPASPAVSTSGSFSGVTFTVPSATKAGTSTVTVTDSSGNSATFQLTVYAAKLTNPSTVVSGRSMAISGTGWPNNDTVYGYLDQGDTQNYFCELNTDASGDLGPDSCAVPATLPEGSYTLSLTDEQIAVNKTITLDPGAHASDTTSGAAIGLVAAGQTVYLTGSGFAANATIKSVEVGSTVTATTPSKPVVAANGSFNGVTFVVPATTAAGPATVTVTDSSNHKATFELNVFAATVSAASSGISGSNLAISGAGWPNDDTVYAYLNQGTSSAYFCELSTDASGNLGPDTCAVPTDLPQGTYTLSLTDEQVTVNQAFTLDPAVNLTNTSNQPITSAAPGATVDLAGSAFTASSTITSVKIGSTTVATTPATPLVTSTGSLSGVSFVVPSSMASGSYTVTVTDSSGKQGTAPLAVS